MNSEQPSVSAQVKSGIARKWTYAVLALAFLFVLMPFLFWQATWFGKPLTDEEVAKDLADREHPRKTQHALAQIADRIIRGDPSVQRWYPHVVALARHSADEIRVTAAWVLGQDNTVPAFHEALLLLQKDGNPMVRRNAALSLVRFADSAGRAELVAMLEPYALSSPHAGVLKQRLKPDDIVNPGTLLGRVVAPASRPASSSEEHEIRSSVPGRVERWLSGDGARIVSGQPIVLLAPSEEMVWEALRALYLVGEPEDLSAVERYTRPLSDFSPRIQQQALLTAARLRRE